jgi:hypothetical protein
MATKDNRPIALRANNPLNLSVDGPKWEGIVGFIPGAEDRPGINIFDSMELGMRAGLVNNFNASRERPKTTIAQQIRRFASTSTKEEIDGYLDFLKQNNIKSTAKLSEVDIFDLTRLQGVFESGRSIVFDDPRWNAALDLLRGEKFIFPNLKTEEVPRRL